MIIKNQSKTKSVGDFLTKINKKFDDKYTYPNIDKYYENRKSIIDIECTEHGSFKKKAQKHLSGQGCFECKIVELVNDNILVGGYCDDLFLENEELCKENAYIYYLEINGGEYYKIGITRKNTKDRIRGIKSKAKQFGFNINNVKILNEKEMGLYDAYKMEQKILKENMNERKYTQWSTELFGENINPIL